MSSYPYISFTNIFNPNDFTEIDGSLSLADADARYFKISGGFVSGFCTFLNSLNVIGTLSINSSPVDLSLISGITAGSPANNKALTLDTLGNINGNISVIGGLTVSTSVSSSIINSSSYLYSGSSMLVSSLTSVTPGTCSPSKALIVDSSSNISGINSLSTTSLTINGATALAGASAWTLNSTALSWTNTTTGTTGSGTSFWTGNNASYNDYALTLFNYYTPSKKWGVRMNMTEASGLYYGIHSQSSGMYFTTRSNTASTNCDLAIFNNVGCVGVGRNTNLNSNHRLEINGSTMISDTANTYSLANAPVLGILNSAQASGNRQEYFTFGKYVSSSDYSAWRFDSYYQSATQDTANYMTLCPAAKTSTTSGWGMVMNRNGQVSFQDSNTNSGNGGLVIQANIVAAVDIYGGISRAISANGELRANATPAVYNGGGGSTRIGLYVLNAIWGASSIYSSSDIRLKKDIEPIPLKEAKKLLDVNAVSYKWINKEDHCRRDVGLIAQDLLEAKLDDLVSFCPNNDKEKFPLGYSYGVSYDRVSMYLLEIIKDQEKRLRALEELKKS